MNLPARGPDVVGAPASASAVAEDVRRPDAVDCRARVDLSAATCGECGETDRCYRDGDVGGLVCLRCWWRRRSA